MQKRKGKGPLGRLGVAAGEMEVLLKVGRSDVDRGVKMTMIQAYINIHKSDLEGVKCQVKWMGILAAPARLTIGSILQLMKTTLLAESSSFSSLLAVSRPLSSRSGTFLSYLFIYFVDAVTVSLTKYENCSSLYYLKEELFST